MNPINPLGPELVFVITVVSIVIGLAVTWLIIFTAVRAAMISATNRLRDDARPKPYRE